MVATRGGRGRPPCKIGLRMPGAFAARTGSRDMSPIEFYLKLRLHGPQVPAALDRARGIAAVARGDRAGALRCDWFLQEPRSELIAMLVLRNLDALESHLQGAQAAYGELVRPGAAELILLGGAGSGVGSALERWLRVAVHAFEFGGGRAAQSAARGFAHEDGAIATPHIEIFTRFAIRSGRNAVFRRSAAALVDIVCAQDPGTPRYDWFYDASGEAGLALDTYADPASMFAHMRNAHDVHEQLLHDATMITEFLGELPPRAREAVAKYDPYVARFVCGIGAHSAGALAPRGD